MGRWTQYDEDEHRLPDGFKRIGYDADTGRYYFSDADGNYWEGPQGAEFGEMKRVSQSQIPIAIDTDASDIENGAPSSAQTYTPQSPYRHLFPFLLIVITVFLLFARLFVFPTSSAPPLAPMCPDDADVHHIQTGDTCWRLASDRGTTLEALKKANEGINCANLQVGQAICIPLPKTPRYRL